GGWRALGSARHVDPPRCRAACGGRRTYGNRGSERFRHAATRDGSRRVLFATRSAHDPPDDSGPLVPCAADERAVTSSARSATRMTIGVASEPDERRESGPELDSRRWLVLAILCLALVVVGIDGTIVNVALPTFVRELGASSSDLQWIVDAYTIVFASFLLI